MFIESAFAHRAARGRIIAEIGEPSVVTTIVLFANDVNDFAPGPTRSTG